ncbi:hypothetical protein HHI36_001461 [Cryptolaemus montrouzieri]|uniref:Uncharacterized protein n=1 Tax=Cryptolaemus montrouzieri TaxID=559131 RepID=A0ABD2P802_9CUCU
MGPTPQCGPLSAENDDNGYGYPESEIPGVKVSKGNKAKRRKSYYRKRVVKKGGDGKTITKEYVRFGHSGNKKGNSKVQSAGETKTQQYDGSYDLLLEAWNDMQKSGDHPNREDIQKFHYKLGYQAAVNDASEAIVSGNIAERGQAAGRAAISFMDKMNIHTLQTAYTEGYEAAKTALKEGDFYLEDLLSTSSSKRVGEYPQKLFSEANFKYAAIIP